MSAVTEPEAEFEDVPWTGLKRGDLFQIEGDYPQELHYGQVLEDANPTTGEVRYRVCGHGELTSTPFDAASTVRVLRGPWLDDEDDDG